jgi:uncharacterized protein YciI
MAELFVVMRRYGPAYARDRPLEEQQDWEAHRAFMNALEAKGIVRLGGPLEEREDVLLIFRANDKDEIERRLADDPWTRSGILATARISRWELRIGVDLLSGSDEFHERPGPAVRGEGET